MPESQREIIVTRVALLELEDERRLAREGYDLLDEKRILLAAAIRRELAELQRLQAICDRVGHSAEHALKRAVSCHGIDELCVYPPLSMVGDRLTIDRSRLLGLELVAARWQAGAAHLGEQAVYPSPEARACALAYRSSVGPLAELAACIARIRRLAREFVRTERRARAIENILLPEITALARLIEERLEQLDQEEIGRMKCRRTQTA
jgi:V/A-type H+/Na+-transporting ATPase subunit D